MKFLIILRSISLLDYQHVYLRNSEILFTLGFIGAAVKSFSKSPISFFKKMKEPMKVEFLKEKKNWNKHII